MPDPLVAKFAASVARTLPKRITKETDRQALGVFLGAAILIEQMHGTNHQLTRDFSLAMQAVKHNGTGAVFSLAETPTTDEDQ